MSKQNELYEIFNRLDERGKTLIMASAYNELERISADKRYSGSEIKVNKVSVKLQRWTSDGYIHSLSVTSIPISDTQAT